MWEFMVGAAGRTAGLVVPALVATDDTAVVVPRDRAGRGGCRRDAHEVRVAELGLEQWVPQCPTTTVVEAARRAGLAEFVFSSVLHPSVSRLSNHAAQQKLTGRWMPRG